MRCKMDIFHSVEEFCPYAVMMSQQAWPSNRLFAQFEPHGQAFTGDADLVYLPLTLPAISFTLQEPIKPSLPTTRMSGKLSQVLCLHNNDTSTSWSKM